MTILAYWKYSNYVQDNANGFGFVFNSSQCRLRNLTGVGDDVFLVTGIRPRSDFELYLAGHLIVSRNEINRPEDPYYRYGEYRIEADRQRSRYFSLDGVRPMTPVLAELTSIRHHPSATAYSKSFQTIRKLNEEDTQRLREYAESLPLHPSMP